MNIRSTGISNIGNSIVVIISIGWILNLVVAIVNKAIVYENKHHRIIST